MNAIELRYARVAGTFDAISAIDIRCEGAYVPAADVSSSMRPSVLWRNEAGNDIIKGDSGDISGQYGFVALKDPSSSCVLVSKTFQNAGQEATYQFTVFAKGTTSY